MPNYNEAQGVADLLSQFDFNIISEGPGDFSTQHRKYTCEFSKPGIESFTTTYQSNPDVHGQPDPDGYTVNETYGLVGSAWMPVHYREGTETGVKEDYSLALDKARGADASEAHGSDEPVSLKAAARESREASAALADNDAHENIGQDAR